MKLFAQINPAGLVPPSAGDPSTWIFGGGGLPQGNVQSVPEPSLTLLGIIIFLVVGRLILGKRKTKTI